jgi:hypothetical protein
MNIESLKDELYRIQEKEVKTESDLKTVDMIRSKIKNSEIEEILKESNILNAMINEISKKVVGEQETIRVILLSACGAFVNNSQIASYNLMVNSEAGAGKDYVVSKTLEIFPEQKVLSRTRISPTAFTYWKTPYKDKAGNEYNFDWTWNGKICYLEDVSSGVMNHEVFKVMCSSGSYATVVIKQVAYDKKIEGKPVMIVTSATAEPNPELTRRFTIVSLDETTNQTEGIMKMQARQDANNLENKYNTNITDAINKLKRVDVRIPYAEDLSEILPSKSIIMRTHFQRFLDYIKASAALYQHQRSTDVDGFIIANGEDYNNARDVLIKLTSNNYMVPLTTNDKNMIALFETDVYEPIPVRDLEAKVSFVGQKQIYNILDKLVKYGFLKKSTRTDDQDSRRNTTVYRLAEKLGSIKIPRWEDIQKEKIIVTL